MSTPRAAERLERLPFTWWHWGIIALAIVTWLTEAIDIQMAGATIPSLQSEFSATATQIGAVATAANLGIVIGLLFAGLAIDRFGKRKVLLYGILLFGLLTMVVALVPSIEWVIALRFLAGLGLGMVFTIPYQIVAEFVPAGVRGLSVGAIGCVLNVGYFSTLLVASATIPNLGWRIMYVFGGVSLIALIFAWIFLPESPRWLEAKGRYGEANELLDSIERKVEHYRGAPLPEPETSRDLSIAGRPDEQIGVLQGIREIFKGELLRRTLVLWVSVSCLWSTWYLFGLYLPQMFHAQGLELGSALLAAAIANAAPIPTHLVGAWLLETWGRKRTIGLYALIALSGVVIFALADSYIVGVVGASLAFGFMAAVFSFQKLFGAENYPTKLRGTGTTWNEAVGRGIAGVAIPFVLSFLLASGGVLAPSALVLVLGVIGLFVFLRYAQETRGMTLEQLEPKRSS